jgi:DNA-binding CsgD family transcriptional regulator
MLETRSHTLSIRTRSGVSPGGKGPPRRVDLVLIEYPADPINPEKVYDEQQLPVPHIVLNIEPDEYGDGDTDRVSSSCRDFLCALEKFLALSHRPPDVALSHKFDPDPGKPAAEMVTYCPVAPTTSFRLTPREQQILEHVLAGHPNKQTAHRLNISQRTVEHHRAAVMLKMGARSVADLVRIVAMREGVRQ